MARALLCESPASVKLKADDRDHLRPVRPRRCLKPISPGPVWTKPWEGKSRSCSACSILLYLRP